jgi:hypothetical protein
MRVTLLINRARSAKLSPVLERLAANWGPSGFIEDHAASDIVDDPRYLILMHGRRARDVALVALRRPCTNVVVLTNSPFHDLAEYRHQYNTVRKAEQVRLLSRLFFASFGCWRVGDRRLLPARRGRWRDLAVALDIDPEDAAPRPWRRVVLGGDIVVFSRNPLGFRTVVYPELAEDELVRRWVDSEVPLLAALALRFPQTTVFKPHPSTARRALESLRSALDLRAQDGTPTSAVRVLDADVPLRRTATGCRVAVVSTGASCVALCLAGVPMVRFGDATDLQDTNIPVDRIAVEGGDVTEVAGRVAALLADITSLPEQEPFLDLMASNCFTGAEIEAGALCAAALQTLTDHKAGDSRRTSASRAASRAGPASSVESASSTVRRNAARSMSRNTA